MYRIRLELGKASDESAFLEYKRKLELRQTQELYENQRKKRSALYISYFAVVLAFLIGIVILAILDTKQVEKYRIIQEELYEIEHRPVYSAAHPAIDKTIVEEMERQRQEEEEARRALMYSATPAENMITLDETILSEFAIVVDTNTDTILADRLAKTRINPASMTKILTVLVAYENISPEQLDDTFTVTPEINYYSYKNKCSAVGFSDNETVPVRDLFYGTILPSGGEAALSLATYVAGSQEAFVELMNQKLEALGLSETAHFTNCIGLYDEEHYCTAYDMAMILHAAIDIEFCKEVLSTKHYVTTSTPEHPNGIEISNWFLRRIEDKPVGGDVICAKTGYVSQSGNCSASFASDGNGNDFIVVTGNAPGNWKCIYDHVRIYRKFFPGYDENQADAAKESAESNQESDE